jgi:hypothetical protein
MENKKFLDLNNNECDLYSSTSDFSSKKSVYKYDCDKFYELLSFHGLADDICQHFLTKNITGEYLLTLNQFTDYQQLKNYLSSEFPSLEAKFQDEKTIKHIFAIVRKYKNNQFYIPGKTFGDCVHGQIYVHPLLISIIDTRQFQRLRNLKQLGILDLVYPSATHNRFTHCIGTSHVAGELVLHLKSKQPSLNITLSDELCIRIAGLCHDLGHGPFSHLFEEAISSLGIKNWKV